MWFRPGFSASWISSLVCSLVWWPLIIVSVLPRSSDHEPLKGNSPIRALYINTHNYLHYKMGIFIPCTQILQYLQPPPEYTNYKLLVSTSIRRRAINEESQCLLSDSLDNLVTTVGTTGENSIDFMNPPSLNPGSIRQHPQLHYYEFTPFA